MHRIAAIDNAVAKMTTNHEPVTTARFAAALAELPLSSLFAKKFEILNSIAHLELSNDELKSYADFGDKDCADAIEENIGVIARMHSRLELLRAEVEARGLNWEELLTEELSQEPMQNVTVDGGSVQESSLNDDSRSAQLGSLQQQLTVLGGGGDDSLGRQAVNQGRLDETPRNSTADQVQQQDDDDDPTDGIHL